MTDGLAMGGGNLPRCCGKNYNKASLESLSEVSMTKTHSGKILLVLIAYFIGFYITNEKTKKTRKDLGKVIS